DAVQRTSKRTGAPLSVERVRDGQRIGIQFDGGMQGRTVAIERLDASEVCARDLACRPSARLLILNQRPNRGLFKIEGGRRLLLRPGLRAAAGCRQSDRDEHYSEDGCSVYAHTSGYLPILKTSVGILVAGWPSFSP